MAPFVVDLDPHNPPFYGRTASVRCADDLALIRRMRHRRNLRTFLHVPGLASDKTIVWQAGVNAALKECGCSLGAKSMCAALGGSIIWRFLYSSWSVSHWLAFVWQSILAVLAAGVIGKLLGLTLAEARLRSIEKQIRKFESKGVWKV